MRFFKRRGERGGSGKGMGEQEVREEVRRAGKIADWKRSRKYCIKELVWLKSKGCGEAGKNVLMLDLTKIGLTKFQWWSVEV